MDFSGGDFHFFQCDLIYLGSLSFFLDESIKVYKFHLFKESAPADNNLAFQRFYFPLKFSIFLSIWLIFFSIKNYNSYFKVLSAYCNVWFIWESVSFGCFFCFGYAHPFFASFMSHNFKNMYIGIILKGDRCRYYFFLERASFPLIGK